MFDNSTDFIYWIQQQSVFTQRIDQEAGCQEAAVALRDFLEGEHRQTISFLALRAWNRPPSPRGVCADGHLATVIRLPNGDQVVVDPTAGQPSLRTGQGDLNRAATVPLGEWEYIFQQWLGNGCAKIVRTDNLGTAQDYIRPVRLMGASFSTSEGEVLKAHLPGCACGQT